ncbi:MAG: type IV pili twitching motility protein PilT, partial [Thiohalophilus sp.]|nr:type IV pili twitching motility protein PilT [Thiohalophilus sp.]
QAMDRIVNFFPEDRFNQLHLDLSLNLKAMIAQQLIPTPDGDGRVLAAEILINTPLMSDHIRKGEISKMKELMTKSTQAGMQTFDQALYHLYKDGSITYEDAINHADSANELRLMIKLGETKGEDMDAMTGALDGITIQET